MGDNNFTAEYLLDRLKDEKDHGISGGIYNRLQVDMAYNSNHIEGSRLTHDQTRYIFDTHTLYADNAKVDDIIETVNHFRCFDYIIDHAHDNVTEDMIKTLHRMLKEGTFSSQAEEAVIGDYKKYPNYVGDIKTSLPKNVSADIKALLHDTDGEKNFDEILDFHARFEKIHPFYDGNGRIGRLIMFKQCLENNIIPFIINDEYKFFYYRGMSQWQKPDGEHGYLRDTCLLMQDNMKAVLEYFDIPYQRQWDRLPFEVTGPAEESQSQDTADGNVDKETEDYDTSYVTDSTEDLDDL